MLRAFGAKDSDPLIQKGIAFLLSSQSAAGAWDDDPDKDDYTCYHATMVAIQALLNHRYRGFGPGIVAATQVMKGWYADEVQVATKANELALSAPKGSESDESGDEGLCADSWLDVYTSDARVQSVSASFKHFKAGAEAKSRTTRSIAVASPKPDAGARVVKLGARLQTVLDSKRTDAEAVRAINSSLEKLSKLQEITVDQLKSSGIGKIVAKLRKFAEQSVAAKAKNLIHKWKHLISAAGRIDAGSI